MKLSFIFELLLIFVFLAFAASRVIDSKGHHHHHGRKALAHRATKVSHKNRQDDANQPNRYCSCNAKLCNCCRDFNIPVVSLQGPGCASLQYLNGDKLAISMSFGERVLTNTTLSGRKPRPICMPLPGGVSKFCGRVYNIRRQGEDFNACLGLELRALKDVEAALRVSCFKFGSDGLKVLPAQPLPTVAGENTNKDEDDDDDDDDDDDYDDEDDFDFDDDDDDDDDDDEEVEDDDDDDNDVETADYETFSLLDDDFIDGLFVGDAEETSSKKPLRKAASTKRPTKRKPVRVATRKPLRRKVVTPKVTKATTTTTTTTTTVKPVEKIVTTQQPVTEVITEKKQELVPVSTISNEIESSTKITENEPTTVTNEKAELGVLQEVQMIPVPEPVNITNGVIEVANDIATNEIMTDSEDIKPSNDEVKTNVTADVIPDSPITTITSYETSVQAVADTTAAPLEETTLRLEATTEEDYENEEPDQSFIIKNDEDEDEEEDDSEESDPITAVVEDVLGEDDDEEDKKPLNGTKVESIKTVTNATIKKEPKDMVDDIVDGMVDMVSDVEDSNESTVATKDEDVKEGDDDDDDDLFDDDDDDDDDDDEEEEDDDDDDDEARKARKHHHKSKNHRRSKDMRS